MAADRKEHARPTAPGEPEAPVSGTRPAPAPAEPEHEWAESQSDHAPEPETALGTDHAAEPEADHERQLEHDLEELTAKAEKAEEYLELAQRTKADFENYRKRAARESAAAQERGVVKLARELLPAVDNLDRALAAAENDRNG